MRIPNRPSTEEYLLGLSVGKRDWDTYGKKIDVVKAFGDRVDQYVQGWLAGYKAQEAKTHVGQSR